LLAFFPSGGSLLLTAENAEYVSIDRGDAGLFVEVEDGSYVWKGYAPLMFKELAVRAGPGVEELYCSG